MARFYLQHCNESTVTCRKTKMHNHQIRDRLQQRRNELQTRSEHIGSDLRGEAAHAEGGFADQATIHANDIVLQAIRASTDSEILQIDMALHRIDEGRYERCATCGGPIGRERLEALPYATTCMACTS
jgi:DnaK suppressor protein